MLSFVIMILRSRWLAKDEIDVINLKTNASDAFKILSSVDELKEWGNVSLLNKRVVPNDLFSEYGFTQLILFWSF